MSTQKSTSNIEKRMSGDVDLLNNFTNMTEESPKVDDGVAESNHSSTFRKIFATDVSSRRVRKMSFTSQRKNAHERIQDELDKAHGDHKNEQYCKVLGILVDQFCADGSANGPVAKGLCQMLQYFE